MKKLFFLFFALLTFSAQAQDWKPYRQLSSAEILHEVQKLGVTGSVLYIAAHPDDENTRVLAWLANEKKVRTAYLSLTRGDGGQNLIGTEQGEALGILRTQELLAARRIDGAEQFFTRAYDFGFSKNPEETFRFWNHDSVLSDVVWVIRKFQPDIIITRFPTTGEGGHGHHTASAILAGEAFDAAADPKRFPEQLQYVQPWKTKRLFWNTFNFGSGGPNTTDSTQLKVDVGGYNALLGKSYGEIAAQARTMHKSQGFGTALQRGSSLEYFKQIKGDVVKKDLFEGIDLTWGRFQHTDYLVRDYEKLLDEWDFERPARNADALNRLQKSFESEAKQKDISAEEVSVLETASRKIGQLYPQLSGVWMEVQTVDKELAPNSYATIYTQLLNRSSTSLKTFKKDGIETLPDDWFNLPKGKAINDTNAFFSLTEKSGNVYWLWEPREGALFKAPSYELRGAAESSYIGQKDTIKTDNYSFQLRTPFVTKTTDPVKGEIYQPLQILPEVTLDILASSLVFENYKPKTVFVKIRCHADSISGKLEFNMPKGGNILWSTSVMGGKISLRKGQERTVEITLTPTKNIGPCIKDINSKEYKNTNNFTKDTSNYFRPFFVSGDKRFNQHARLIHYSHIPDQNYLSEAKAYVTAFPLQTGGKKIGYITGAGDEVPEALRNVGYTVTELNEKEVQTSDLSRFDAIVTGVRAYNTQDWLQAAYPRLMDYVKKGGNLVVQYNTNSRIGPVKAQIGPDSFTITRDRVTDENAAVTFLAPQHPALNTPNKITADDFNGWIQERSIYHASNWASSFTPLLSMADAGEKPSNGSLIVEPYGKGNFVYTGLVFFRELPAGIPGAYRLFANLLALPKR